MFPNLRLLIGALFASVIVLCCGFGVFAAFGVNHEPLGRLPANTAALQLVAEEPARPAQTWGVPFRPQDADKQTGAADVSAPAPVRSAAIILTSAATPALVPIDSVGASGRGQASQALTPSAATAGPALDPSHAPVPPAPPNPAPTTGASAAATPPAAPVSAMSRAVADASPQTPKTSIAWAAATEPAPNAVQPASSAARPPTEVRRKAKSKPRRIARKPVDRHRVSAKRGVIRKTPVAAVVRFGEQQNDFQNTVFRSAPGFPQQPQTPNQAAKKSAKDGSPVNPFAWPDPH